MVCTQDLDMYCEPVIEIRPELVTIEQLKKDGLLIKGMANPTKEEQVVAVFQNPQALNFIQDPCQEAMLLYATQHMKKLGFLI